MVIVTMTADSHIYPHPLLDSPHQGVVAIDSFKQIDAIISCSVLFVYF